MKIKAQGIIRCADCGIWNNSQRQQCRNCHSNIKDQIYAGIEFLKPDWATLSRRHCFMKITKQNKP